jgi:protein-disulfide isomerase-like protein with CxxC motif
LLTDDPWFAWLHPLSELIVTLDETLDAKAKTPLTAESAAALLQRTAELLVATETGEGFARNYFDALQRDPEVVMAHAEAAKWFRRRARS